MISLTRLPLAAVVVVAASLCPGQVATLRVGNPSAAAPASAGKPEGKPPTGYVALTRTAPPMDGKGADPVWARAQALRLEWTLDGSAPAGVVTEVRLLRDDEMLYVFARCAEPFIGKLVAGNRGHDEGLWDDDSVEMFIGTDDDWDYYHFIVNSRGATYDGFNKDTKWNCGYKAAAAVGKTEWTATWAIPLAKIKFGGKVPARWIANFTRNRHTRGRTEELAWSPTLGGDSHVPRRFGSLLFEDPPQATLDAQKPQPLPPGVSIVATGEGEGGVRFDLSGLPKDAKVHRADLILCRSGAVTGKDDEALVEPEVFPLFAETREGESPKPEGKPLSPRGPWFDCLDATDAVRAWTGGKPNDGFFVKAFPLWNAGASALQVVYSGQPKDVPPQVTGLKVLHRSGQTFITWKEIEDLVGADQVKWGDLRRILGGMDGKRQVRYCVYRSAKPITAATLEEAEWIATVNPLSGWNANGRCIEKPIDDALSGYALMHGQWDPFVNASVDGEYGLDCRMDRLVIEDGGKPLPRDAGLYVHTVAEKAKACYAVLTMVNGRQNTAEFSAGNATTEAVDEAPAAPAPVLQGALPRRPYWNYAETRFHYVQWAAPPMANLPNQYYNWAVAVPTEPGKPGAPGLELSLPREGRSYYWTQYRVSRDSIVLTPHDFPVFSMWYGYHESLGTLKSFRSGSVHNYTERRILAFIDWAQAKWAVDKGNVIVTGMSAGAAGGADRLARRYPNVFRRAELRGPVQRDYAAVVRGGGRRSALADQMETVWGKLAWNIPADTGKPVWAELSK